MIPGPGLEQTRAQKRAGEIPLTSRMAKNKKNKISVLNLTDVLDAYEMQKRRMSSKARSNENKDPSGAQKRPRQSRRAPLEGLDLNRMCGNQRQSLGTVY